MSKKEKSIFISAYDIVGLNVKSLINTIIDRNKSEHTAEDIFDQIRKNENLRNRMVDLMIAEMNPTEEKVKEKEHLSSLPFTIEGKVEVPLNHNQSFEQARDASKQDYTNPSIQLDRIISGAGYGQSDTQETVSVEIAHFGKSIESEDADKIFDGSDYRHATPVEVFAFAATDEGKAYQKKFWMVSLGTKFRDDVSNPCVLKLHLGSGRRLLDLGRWSGKWGGGYRFLVVRKSQ